MMMMMLLCYGTGHTETNILSFTYRDKGMPWMELSLCVCACKGGITIRVIDSTTQQERFTHAVQRGDVETRCIRPGACFRLLFKRLNFRATLKTIPEPAGVICLTHVRETVGTVEKLRGGEFHPLEVMNLCSNVSIFAQPFKSLLSKD